jgi:hypothetical protein
VTLAIYWRLSRQKRYLEQKLPEWEKLMPGTAAMWKWLYDIPETKPSKDSMVKKDDVSR